MFDAESRVVETPAFFSDGLDCVGETDRVRLLEVHEHDLLHVQRVDHVARVRRALDVVARDVAEERRRRLTVSRPASGTVRVADGEMCAIPAWKYVVLDAATAPDVDGPRIATTLLSRDVLLRQRLRGGRALLDRRVAEHELDLQTERLARAS